MTDLRLPEVAAELRLATRTLRDWLAKNPRDNDGRPYSMGSGRGRTFTRHDVDRIREARRCPYIYERRGKQRTRLKSAGRTSVSAWSEAAALLNDPSLSPSSTSLNAPLSKANGPRPRLELVQGSPRS